MRQFPVLAAAVAACVGCSPAAEAPACAAPDAGDIALPGGRFLMGADPLLPEEGPPREATVAPFRIDRTEVTNAQFAAFVRATRFVTLAERAPDPRFYPGVPPERLKPSSVVFTGPQTDPARADPARWLGCFPSNGFGLFDMAGNVWEWTKDAVPGEAGAPTHVIKGGSYLCAESFCFRYRPSSRQSGPPDTGASHIGFRTVRRGPTSAATANGAKPQRPEASPL
ncbi:formylglycine-generating enzyme family protein [Phenylobacterium sp. VNQ135]|uniref:formylglycine-generating enzyme family protein n=1 Tax=Phenylobacterium sp. VNQ135 TaxID=3400922 RepID=UPI003C084C7F